MPVQINAHPHAGQVAVHQHVARFKILAAGRRWGKTRLGVNECLDVASKGGRAWWVAPSYKMSEVGWRPLRRLGYDIGADVRRVDRMVCLGTDGWVQVRSADDPQSLRGEGLDLVVMDECAFIKEAAWNEALRPALSDRLGKALFISTPKGHNWFWRLWQRGQEEGNEWQSWQCPTGDNPYIPASEIEDARLSLPERIFQQEYLAMFLEDAGIVFRHVMDAATATELEKGAEGRQYAYGVDWGKHEDFTVISVMDNQTKELVKLDRFNQIDYAVQVGRLKALADRFPPSVIIAEQNAMGEPLIEQLHRDGLPVRGFVTTNASKAQAVEALQLAFERSEIKILPDPVSIAELQAFELDRLPSGMPRYQAPEGMHDDTVISLMLAWHAVDQRGVFFTWL